MGGTIPVGSLSCLEHEDLIKEMSTRTHNLFEQNPNCLSWYKINYKQIVAVNNGDSGPFKRFKPFRKDKMHKYPGLLVFEQLLERENYSLSFFSFSARFIMQAIQASGFLYFTSGPASHIASNSLWKSSWDNIFFNVKST